MYYSDIAKNTMLNQLTVNKVSLHTANPGVDGTANEYDDGDYTRMTASFALAEEGKRELSSPVVFAGVAGETVSWVGFWYNSVFYGAAELDGAPVAFDAATGLLVLVHEDTYYGIGTCT